MQKRRTVICTLEEYNEVLAAVGRALPGALKGTDPKDLIPVLQSNVGNLEKRLGQLFRSLKYGTAPVSATTTRTRELMTVAEAAKELGRSAGTIYRWIKKGYIQVASTTSAGVGRKRMNIFSRDLERFRRNGMCTVFEVATILDRSQTTIYRLIKNGKFPSATRLSVNVRPGEVAGRPGFVRWMIPMQDLGDRNIESEITGVEVSTRLEPRYL